MVPWLEQWQTLAGSVNEAGLFALRDKQESVGGKRGSRTSSTERSVTTSSGAANMAISTTVSSSYNTKTTRANGEKNELIVEAEALLAAAAAAADDEAAWGAAGGDTDNFSLNVSASSSSSSSLGDSSLSLSLLATQPSQEIIVKPLSKVVLPCELEGNATKLLMPAVKSYRIRPATWLHEGAPVDMITIDTRTEMSGTGHRYIGDSTTAALHIDNVRLEDDGIWKCQIEDERGNRIVGRSVKLVVLEAPRGTYLMIDGRRLDPGNQFIPVKEGSELTLECAAEGGNPPPILAWGMTLSQATLEGPEQPPDNLTILPVTSPVRTSASLKVLRGHHNATIICVARHITLTMPMNASILLDVQYTPSFAITRIPGFGIPIVEGMSVSLKCEVDSNPSSAPVWQRNDGAPPVEQSDDGWLNFTKISRAEKGWYKCYTRHMLGIYTSIGYYLNVRHDPEIETQAKSFNGEESRKMEVQIGGAVTLECDGGCWGHGPSMNPAGGPGPLALSKVVYQDAGEYRCVAPDHNLQGAWRAQLPYYVKVNGRPMIHPVTQTMTTIQGDSLDVMVEFCAEPTYTKVLWMSQERVYVPGAKLRDGVKALLIEDGGTKSCFRSILRFDRVQPNHAGEWMLLVRSPEGIADSTLTLNVTLAAGYSHAPATSPAGSAVTLLLSFVFVAIFGNIRPTHC
ncbi:hypothetical protein TKK_0018089 [Trichogramma kaykai]